MVRTSLASQDHKKHYQDGDDDDNEYIYTYMEHTLHGKPYFLFPGVLKRWSFQKKSRWNIILLVLLGKIMFLFLENMILTLDGKWKLIFSEKVQGNMIFSSGLPKRWSFQKGPRQEMIFLVLSRKIVFFFPKTRCFFLGQEASDDLSQEIHGNKIFSVYTCGCYKPGVTPPCQKKSRMNLSRKNTPKGDWRSRLTSWKELQQFPAPSQRTAQSSLLSSKKNQET